MTENRCDLARRARLDAEATSGPWFVRAMDDGLACRAFAAATAPNTSGKLIAAVRSALPELLRPARVGAAAERA